MRNMKNIIISGNIQIKRKRFWVIRFAEISDGQLSYYYNQGDTEKRGQYKLDKCDIFEYASPQHNNEMIIQLMLETEILLLKMDTSLEHQRWLQELLKFQKKISQSSYQSMVKLEESIIYKNPKGESSPEDKLYPQSPPEKAAKPFLLDKNVIKFKGEDQIMLKNNVSFMVQEFKNMIMTDCHSDMKVYSKKIDKKKQIPAPAPISKKMVRDQKSLVWSFSSLIIKLKDTLGIETFIVFVAIVSALIMLCVYLILELTDTSNLIISIIAALNILLLPFISLRLRRGDGSKSPVTHYNIVAEYTFKQNLNHFLFIIQNYDRKRWLPYVISSKQNKDDTMTLQIEDDHYTFQEQFQVSVFPEHKFMYIVDHQKNQIQRVFEIDHTNAEDSSFNVRYYFKDQHNQLHGMDNHNSPIMLRSLTYLIKEELNIPDSPLSIYKDERDRQEILIGGDLKSQSKRSQKMDQKKFTEIIIGGSADNHSSLKSSCSLQSSGVLHASQIIQKSPSLKSSVALLQNEEVKINFGLSQSLALSYEMQGYYDMAFAAVDELEAQLQLNQSNPQKQWKEEEYKGSFKVHSREYQAGMSSLRVEDVFQIQAQSIVEVLEDLPKRAMYDDMFKCVDILLNVTSKIKIIRVEFRGMFVVRGRDFVMISCTIERNGKIYLISKGIDDEQKFPLKKDVVRGFIEIAGYVIERQNNDTSLVKYLYIADCNGKNGKLPSSIQTQIAKQQAKGFKNLRKLVEKNNKKKQ